MEDETTDRSDAAEDPRSARYGFGTFLGDTWRVFKRDPQKLVLAFCIVHVIAALVPFLVFFEVSDRAALPLILLTRVVVPVIAGSIAMSTGSRILGRSTQADATPVADSGARPADVLALSLLATMFAVGCVLVLGAYGFLILHLFYGPPIAMQAAALEGSPFRDAATRARLLLRGNWRTILYLLNLAVFVGIFSFILLAPVYGFLPEDFDLAISLAVSVVQGIVLGVLTSFMAAGQVAVYENLRRQPRPSDEETGTDSELELPSGIDGSEATSQP